MKTPFPTPNNHPEVSFKLGAIKAQKKTTPQKKTKTANSLIQNISLAERIVMSSEGSIEEYFFGISNLSNVS